MATCRVVMASRSVTCACVIGLSDPFSSAVMSNLAVAKLLARLVVVWPGYVVDMFG